MTRLARTATRHPRIVLACSFAVVALLSLVSLGLVGKLSPAITVVPGSESARAEHLARAEFGPSVLVPILLEGPKAALDEQGPALVRALRRRPDTRVLSAWDEGSASEGLRPRRTAAAIVVSVDKPMDEVVDGEQAAVERTVDRVVSDPVTTYVTGQAALDRAFKDNAVSDARRLGAIAIGVLFVLLLVGLRAPLAAAVLTAIGAAIAVSTFGILALAANLIAIDALSMIGAATLGMALGVGFSMMVLDRFREERGGSEADPAAAVTRALARTGPAVLLAGGLLITAQLLADLFGPTEILQSLGVGFFACAVLALLTAVVVLPALLTLVGAPLVAGSFAAPRLLQRAWDRLVGAGSIVRRRAVISGALATGLLVLLAVPALALDIGPLHATMLPPDSEARIAFERMQKVMGPGWPTPYNIIVVSEEGPITSSAMLKKIDRFEARIARDPEADSVVGPGAVRAETKDLGTLPKQLKESGKLLKKGPKDLAKLEDGLGQAGAGAQQLQDGLREAADGAGQLAGGAGAFSKGSGQAQAGTQKLEAGLAKAEDGSAQISDGLSQALAGAEALEAGSSKALAGAEQLTGGLGQAQGPVTAGLPSLEALAENAAAAGSGAEALRGTSSAAVADVDAAIAELQSLGAGQSDPRYGDALAALERAREAAAGTSSGADALAPKLGVAAAGSDAVVGQVTELAAGLTLLHDGAGALQAGIGQLQQGNAELADGIGRLSAGGGDLNSGVGQLREGAGALENGLGQLALGARRLQSGAGQLESGLAGAVGPTGELITGLGKMEAGVSKFGGKLPSPRDLEKLQRKAPGLFDSGYFVLAAVEGAPPQSRNQASFAVNLAKGGTAGQIVVVSKHAAGEPETEAFGERLKDMSDDFAASAPAQVALGGPASELADFESEPADQIPAVVAALAIATALILMIALRAVLLPLAAVAFNLLAAAATFGVLQLLFGGAEPPLSGPGWIDPVNIIETFAAVFGLSLIYLVVLLVRTREEYVRSGDPSRALEQGMSHTAAGATGVGLVMLASVITFATTELINVRQLMVGIAVVVLIDVLLVRPVLLPAAAKLLGRAGWWPTRPRVAPSAPAPPSPPATTESTAPTRRMPEVSKS